MSRDNEDSSSLVVAHKEIPPENNATSGNEFSHENAEIENGNNFDEHAVEVNDSNAKTFASEEDNESVSMIFLKNIKDEIKEEISERKKGLKKN